MYFTQKMLPQYRSKDVYNRYNKPKIRSLSPKGKLRLAILLGVILLLVYSFVLYTRTTDTSSISETNPPLVRSDESEPIATTDTLDKPQQSPRPTPSPKPSIPKPEESTPSRTEDEAPPVSTRKKRSKKVRSPPKPIPAPQKENTQSNKPSQELLESSYVDPTHSIPMKSFFQDEHVVHETTDFIHDQNIQDKGCGHTLDRDYTETPILIKGPFYDRIQSCPVGCKEVGTFATLYDVSIHMPLNLKSECDHTKQYSFTMENLPLTRTNHLLVGTTSLKSDVPVPYFGWGEYDFMKPPVKKTATAMMAVFVSNCLPSRLLIINEMMQHGVTVHSYGKCMNNAKIPEEIRGSYLEQKSQISATYKFTFAVENSEADDYVTEKLFGTLTAGSIPIYMGARNARKFEPSNKSVIYISDFESIEKLAEYMIELDKNETLYNEYLTWKNTGPTINFISLVDQVMQPYACRLCIRIADHHRAIYGNMHGHELREIAPEEEGVMALRVRPQGEFYMKYIYLRKEEMNIKGLNEKVMQLYKNHDPKPLKVMAIYRLDVLSKLFVQY